MLPLASAATRVAPPLPPKFSAQSSTPLGSYLATQEAPAVLVRLMVPPVAVVPKVVVLEKPPESTLLFWPSRARPQLLTKVMFGSASMAQPTPVGTLRSSSASTAGRK